MTSSTAAASTDSRRQTIVSFSLDGAPSARAIPVSTGIPLPQGLLRDPATLLLSGGNHESDIPTQIEPLAHWPDGSLRAIRLDFLANPHETADYQLVQTDAAPHKPIATDHLAVDLHHNRLKVSLAGHGELELFFPLTLSSDKIRSPRWSDLQWTAQGPIRWTARIIGQFPGRHGPRLDIRLSAFADTPHLELNVTLLNPRRARHPGGLWDLGDANSLYFQAFDVSVRRDGPHEIYARLHSSDPPRGPLTQADLYQDSSGGENWNSINHVNAAGQVPCRFRGYQYYDDLNSGVTGDRATPTFTLAGPHPLSITLPEFWQQFPKALRAASGDLHAGLFPADWNDAHELQGGEQKTHTLWLSLDDNDDALAFTHHRPLAILPPEWHERCRLYDAFSAAHAGWDDRLRDYLAEAIAPHTGLAARREVIDEYGWRHWGELWADHEQPKNTPAPPIISHYNNQYDVIEGCLRQFARSGDRAWWNLAEPLARHVVDIDIYHTDQDRAVYNHGHFWHTDHYHAAHTATHRTYTRQNAVGRAGYGGGPSCSHCYSTGLLHLYYLTGNPVYRDTVIGLAEWLIATEDGARTEFCIVDSGPTGITTVSAEPWYHGPGRAPANSLGTLVDAWELTGEARYRDQAEMIIRRVVVPGEDFDALELLDVERRWFYIMFLHALSKYLDAKITAGENDAAYGYAVAAARDYAAWMLENERPYFDVAEQLEFPTETWGAQDIRKANAMRRLARYCDPQVSRDVRDRANQLADRGWHDLLRFETRHKLRPLAIMLVEGFRDEFYRKTDDPPPPDPKIKPERRAQRPPFHSQRDRARAALRSPTGLLRIAARSLNPRIFPNLTKALRPRF